MSSERATVIVPTYKHQDYLRCSLLSILNQTVPVKIIIVPVIDDQRTLEELEHLNEILKGFDRKITIIPSDEADVFVQMQLGLDNVDTEYFTAFGSDDFMLPNQIGRMLELADQSGHSNPIIGLSFAFTDEKLTIKSIHKIRPFSLNRMMKGSCIPDVALVPTKLAKLVGGFTGDRDWGYLNHFAMYHRLLRTNDVKIILSSEIGFLYRQLPKSRHSERYATREGIKIHRAKMRELARYYWGG